MALSDARSFRVVVLLISFLSITAFANAAQCEEQRMAEIKTWKRDGIPKGANKDWLYQRWRQEFLIRCMPYDLWWKTQQTR